MSQVIFSIILPVYNQQDHLEKMITGYLNALKKSNYIWELIIVVNGSKDLSFKIAAKMAQLDYRIRAYNLRKAGWGRAVKFGIIKSNGEFICYTNSAKTQYKDLIKLLKAAKRNPLAITKAVRRNRRVSFIHKIGSTLYNLEYRILFRLPTLDVNGTPKIIPRFFVKKLIPSSLGDLFDAELLIKTYRQKLGIHEIPISEGKRLSGKSTTTLFSACKMYLGLIKLRFLPSFQNTFL